MNTARYRWPAVLLHWLQAGLVIYLLWLGWQMTELPKGAGRSAAYGLHKSFGLLVLFLTLMRLGWRLRHAPPAPLVEGREAQLAGAVHVALYAFLLLAPLAGYLASSFTPYPLKFFGIEVIKAGWPDEGLNAAFRTLHQGAVWCGAGLIALHLAGVLKHLFRREAVLQRMLPGRLFHK